MSCLYFLRLTDHTIFRTGELTRGMCVVDRRNVGALGSTTTYTEVQETLQSHIEAGSANVDDFGSVLPVPDGIEDDPSRGRKKDEPGGVPVVEYIYIYIMSLIETILELLIYTAIIHFNDRREPS